MKAVKRVLVTGAAGELGRAACRELKSRGHYVRGFDRKPMPELDDAVVGDLTDPDTLRRAVRGCDTVVHYAATPDDADFMTDLLPNNIVGVYRVFEVAREEKIHRLIVASSGQVAWGHERYRSWQPVRVSDGIAPRNHYAVTKVFAEAMAEMYAYTYGLSVIVVRPGWLPRESVHVRQMAQSPQAQAQYLSPADAGRFTACAVEAENVLFAVVYATSRPNGPTVWDLTEARELLGFEPQDTYPDGLPHPIPKD